MTETALLVPNLRLGTHLSPQLRCPHPAPRNHVTRLHAAIPVRKDRSACRGWATELPGQGHSQTEFGNEGDVRQTLPPVALTLRGGRGIVRA